MLYLMGKGGLLSPTNCAAAFISLMSGYCLTALLATHDRTKAWIQKVYNTQLDDSVAKISIQNLRNNLLHTIRILLVPLISSSLIFVILSSAMAEGGILESLGGILPVALACLFIFWSASQALSFRYSVEAWIRGVVEENPRDTGTSLERNSGIQMATVAIISLVVSYSLLSLIGTEGPHGPNGAFIVVPLIALTQGGILWHNRKVRLKLLDRKGGMQYDLLWGIALHGFAAWHLLSIYRRLVSPADSGFDLIEETLLMIFTVVMSIWGMSSRGMLRNYRLFTSETMLFWGLAFGFGYAGSVTMLVVGIEGDLKSIFAIGHLVTWITLMMLHRSTCKDFLTSKNVNSPSQMSVS